MPLITPTDPNWGRLFQPSDPVTDYATQVAPYIQEMRRLMEQKQGGYAISAVQIGVPYRFFIWGGRHWKSNLISICVNPEIGFAGHDIVHKHEGCMSFPGKRRDVMRYTMCSLKWEDRFGVSHMQATEWPMLAYTWQHEMNHLDGEPLWLIDGSENPQFNVKSNTPESVTLQPTQE